jgi:uracil phosphoribosyltransferase
MPSKATVVDHPLIQHKLSMMRKVETPPAVFRQLLKEIAMLLAHEALRDLPMTTKRITTPMEEMDAPVIEGRKPVIISILRAGNGLLDGMLDLVPMAKVGHIGMYRDHDTLEAIEYYLKVPKDIEERPVIVVDPMLATANSSIASITRLKEVGAKNMKFVCLLAAPEGVEALSKAHPDVPIITAAVDSHLNELGYIVPGLGDAGDRIYGTV